MSSPGRRVAAQGVSRGQRADRGDRDRSRAPRRVSADQLDGVRLGEREHARGEGLDPRLVGVGQGDREQEPARVGAHRREVREVHRERLGAEAPRVGAGQEVRALGERVGGEREDQPGRRLQECAVVADP